MKIKKNIQFIGFYLLLVLVVGMYFTSCDDTVGSNPFGEDSQGTNPIGDMLSFNMSSIAGLAVSGNAYEARNGISPRSGGDEKLLKIKEDGSIEKFMNVPANANLSDVSYITKSPVDGSNEIYVIFDRNSQWWEEYYDSNGNWYSKEYSLGQFICVFEDGSYYDILQSGSSLKWTMDYYQMDFDNRGNVYYIANENTGSSWTDVIYKFNPQTKKSEKLVAAVSDTTYEEFYISDSGDWLFVKGTRYGDSFASFLRAIPVSDPDNPSNLWYQTNGDSSLQEWIYNENTRDVYFIVDGMLYKIPYKKGGYDTNNREFVGGRNNNSGSFSANDIIVNVHSSDYNGRWNEYRYSLAGRASEYDLDLEPYSTKYYYFIDSATSKVDYEAIVNYIFARLLNTTRNKTEYIEDLGTRFVNYRNDYEIRFDEFAKIEGFEKLATETQDKYGNQLADEELFEAIIEKDLLHLLGVAINSDRYKKQNIYDAYDNNFFADVLYLKNSNTKINPELFYWETGAGFDNFYGLEFIQSNYYSYLWKDEFMTEIGNVDATKVLAKFAEACGRNEIDFSLECYKNSGSYSDLYTDLKNEDAILFIDSDSSRVSLLSEAMTNGSNYNFSEFLSKTCFIKGTDTPAITSGTSSSTVIEWNYLDDLNFAGNALYAIDSINNKLVQLTDNDGVGVCKFVLLDYEHPLKISSIMVYENDFYFRNSIINSIGDETGCHTILKFDPELSEIEDMMWDVPNSENYEITSYSIVGNDLYPCMVRGTNIIIGRIDLSTRFYEKFSDTNAEIKQLLMLK